MKIVKGNFGEVRFQDCIEGMKELKDKEFDLCLTDPPYGVNYTDERDETINYNDSFIPSFDWFDRILMICNGLVFTPGMPGLYDYIIHKKPTKLLRYAYYPGNGKRYHVDPILSYGTITNISHIRDIKEFPSQKFEGFNNPSPKSYPFWFYYLKRLYPASVIDPFMGSGTTAEVCEELGINYLGFEIMEEYSVDIEKRIQRGIRKHSQQTLSELIQ
jgi:hypothetical protein